MNGKNSSGEIFCITGPDALLIAQKDGEIFVIQNRDEFNKQFDRKYTANRIRGLQRFDHLSFSARPGRPHLLADGDRLDISTAGAMRAIVTIAGHRNLEFTLPDDLRWLFDKHSQSLQRAARWFDAVWPALVLDRAPPFNTLEDRAYQRELADPYAREFWSAWRAVAAAK